MYANKLYLQQEMKSTSTLLTFTISIIRSAHRSTRLHVQCHHIQKSHICYLYGNETLSHDQYSLCPALSLTFRAKYCMESPYIQCVKCNDRLWKSPLKL